MFQKQKHVKMFRKHELVQCTNLDHDKEWSEINRAREGPLLAFMMDQSTIMCIGRHLNFLADSLGPKDND